MGFKKEFSLFGILCASLGGIIGSGWLFGSLFAAQFAGPAAILSWLIGGFLIMLLALTFAELAVMFPISGGVASYPLFSHGRIVGFVLTWLTWITYVVSVSQEVQATVFYLANKFPSWVTQRDGHNVFSAEGYVVAFSIMFVLILLNSFGARFLSRANSFISVWKVIIPIGVVVAFLYTRHDFNNLQTESWSTFAPQGFAGILSAIALAGVVYSYCGFQHGALLAGEAKNPQKAVPIALIGSILICMCIYMGLQYAFIAALPSDVVAQGWAHLSFVGDAGPLAGLAVMLGLTWLAVVLYFDAIASPLGTGVLYVASGARLVQNMSTSGNAPRFFNRLSDKGIPMRAIGVNFLVAMLAFLPFDSWQAIVSFLSSALVFSFAVGPICLAAMRKQHPNKARPFRLPAYQWISFAAFYVCNLMIFWSGWGVVWKLALCLGVGALVFVISHVLAPRPEFKLENHDWKSAWWLLPYMTVFCVISYYGSFKGGQGVIPLGWDFLVMGLFSFGVFWLSQKCMLPPAKSAQHMEDVLSYHEVQKQKV